MDEFAPDSPVFNIVIIGHGAVNVTTPETTIYPLLLELAPDIKGMS